MTGYQLLISFYKKAIDLAALFGHSKAKLFVKYRSIGMGELIKTPTIWIHAASAGEGNQAIPIAIALRKKYNFKIAISFFSPSGYDFHKDSPYFDTVLNLPLDSRSNAISLIKKINPPFVIFIRKEFWWNYLDELKNQNIPTFLVNAPMSTFSTVGFHRYFLKNYQLKCLQLFTKIFTCTELLNSKPIDTYIGKTIGDTKFEGAFSIDKKVENEIIDRFKQNNKCIIIGSSWPTEEKLLKRWLNLSKNKSHKIIIAPHEIDSQRIKSLLESFQNSTLYSKPEPRADVMIIDKIGLLKNIYKYADVAIIGGGFNKGIHNILEAVAFHVPVLFGPKYEHFDEANQLIGKHLAFTFKEYSEFESKLNNLLTEKVNPIEIKNQLAEFVEKNINVSDKIVAEISDCISLQTLNLK